MSKPWKPYVYKRAEDLGMKVSDAKTRVLLTVTANDVVKAKKKNSEFCALARAALRLPGVNAAYVFRNRAFLEYDDRMLRFVLPHSVQKEIVSFDRAQIFAPGVYQLSPPSPSDKPEARSHAKRRRKIEKQKESKGAGLSRSISRIAANDPPNDTPEQREFDNKLATVFNRNAGRRTVTGIRNGKAPEPVMAVSPKRGYVHRTQYIRDIHDEHG